MEHPSNPYPPCSSCGGPWPAAECSEGWKPHADRCEAAIRAADRKLRHELEAIEDPKLRRECLEAF